jgi:hypothetical protein
LATKTRCFSTIKALQRFHPVLLADGLRKFPDYMALCHIKIPKSPDRENMPYDDIKNALMSGDIPQDLDDVLFFTCLLGTAPGWEKIQAEARFQKCNLDFQIEGLTAADLALKAWLYNWPHNRQLLEQSYARAKVHARSSYVYYAPIRDVRSKYKSPSPKMLEEFSRNLSTYFMDKGLGAGTNIVRYEYEKEIWFLIRYPGHPRRYSAISDSGESTSMVFRPEEYDAVVYHKEFGDLRMNTNSKLDHAHYRVVFADLLLGASNLFHPKYQMIKLDPLLGDCATLFRAKDIPGLAEIVPIEVTYNSYVKTGVVKNLKAKDDAHLLYYDPAKGNLMEDPDADSVVYARFRYRLKNRTSYSTISVHAGHRLAYERDGDSSVLEHWLRSRKFIVSPLEEQREVAQSA